MTGTSRAAFHHSAYVRSCCIIGSRSIVGSTLPSSRTRSSSSWWESHGKPHPTDPPLTPHRPHTGPTLTPFLVVHFPGYGVRLAFYSMLLFFIAVPAPPDYSQLVKFVLGFRGTQFISGGVIAGLQALFQLHACVAYDLPIASCAPGVAGTTGVMLEGLEFIAQSALVYVGDGCGVG